MIFLIAYTTPYFKIAQADRQGHRRPLPVLVPFSGGRGASSVQIAATCPSPSSRSQTAVPHTCNAATRWWPQSPQPQVPWPNLPRGTAHATSPCRELRSHPPQTDVRRHSTNRSLLHHARFRPAPGSDPHRPTPSKGDPLPARTRRSGSATGGPSAPSACCSTARIARARAATESPASPRVPEQR